MAALVNPVTKVWLRGEGFYEELANGALAGGLLGSAIAQKIMSGLALRAAANAEGLRQLGFLGGPLARDIHVVKGARRDLIAKPIMLQGDFLGYGSAIPAFVIGVKEQDDGTSELTVLRKLGDPGEAQLWRIRAPGTYLGGYLGIADLTMSNLPGSPDLALGRPAIASAEAVGYEAAKAVDGAPATFFTTGAVGAPAGGHWLQIDFGAPVIIRYITMRVRPDAFREDPSSLIIERSTSPGVWVEAWQEPAIPAWAAFENRAFVP